MLPLRKECVRLTTPTCCAPVSWHKPLSCFAGSVLTKGQSRHFSSPGVKICYHLEGVHCLGHPLQWLLLRAYLKCCRNFGKTHAANNYDIRKKPWGWKTIIIFLPLFFFPFFSAVSSPNSSDCSSPLTALTCCQVSSSKPRKSAHTALH